MRAGWQEGDIVFGTDHYQVLGLSVDHTPEDLKKAYRTASRAAHPDKHKGSNDAFQKVATAYETLEEPTKRAMYDEVMMLSDQPRYLLLPSVAFSHRLTLSSHQVVSPKAHDRLCLASASCLLAVHVEIWAVNRALLLQHCIDLALL